jgi:hypothetical protein
VATFATCCFDVEVYGLIFSLTESLPITLSSSRTDILRIIDDDLEMNYLGEYSLRSDL